LYRLFIVTFTYVLVIYHRFTPPSFSHTPTFLENFNTFYYSIFILLCTSTVFALPHPLHLPSPLPLQPTPDRTSFTSLSFIFYLYIDCSKRLHLGISHCIYCTLIQLTPLFLILSLFSCSPIIQPLLKKKCY
jgi:hypothetical protein